MKQADYPPALVYFLFLFSVFFLFVELSSGCWFFCHQHEQTWGKLCVLLCRIGVSVPHSAGGQLFGLRQVPVIENSFPGGLFR